jgi:predicted GIY-YIG superfamily endonuclease
MGKAGAGAGAGEGTVYLLHLHGELGNARHRASHYLGWARDVRARLRHHQSGDRARGAAFTAAAVERGIAFEVARTWPGGRALERRLKRRKAARALCPLCSGAAAAGRGAYPPGR